MKAPLKSTLQGKLMKRKHNFDKFRKHLTQLLSDALKEIKITRETQVELVEKDLN